MKNHAYLIHGWGGTPDEGWFPWFVHQLRSNGFKVYAPKMPHDDIVNAMDSLHFMQKMIGIPNIRTFLIGHSIGVAAVMRYIESLPDDAKIGGIVLVSGGVEPTQFDELKSFYETPLPYEKVRNIAKHIVVIHGTNDPFVPFKNAEILKEKLNARLIPIENGLHLNGEAGITELPEALDALIEMAK